MRDDRSAGVAVFVALFAIYAATLAPDVTFWDSGEFLAAIHSLGIPHPPGTPVYILLANAWTKIFAPMVGFAFSVNLFSAFSAAISCGILATLFSRWLRDPIAGIAAGLCAGATSTLWLSATETEVYAVAFVFGCILLLIADRIRNDPQLKWWILLAYVAGLSWALHLTALLTLPAALLLASNSKRVRIDPAALKNVALTILFFCAGASAILFMYFRARHDPAINQGNPASISALVDVIFRRQYAPVNWWPRQAPLYLQIGNLFEWADWQVALGLDPANPPGWTRTPITVVYAALAIAGALYHRRVSPPSFRTMLLLLGVSSLGVVAYLNLKAGPSYGEGILPANALHEVRERDYFFIWLWVSGAAWAAIGARSIFLGRTKSVSAIVLGFAALPIVLNWRAVDRSHGPKATEASSVATQILDATPGNAVLLARGDNDTYPVWYMRTVNRARPDVSPITIPMLPAQWYREEIERRYHLLPQDMVVKWIGTDATLRGICSIASVQNRLVVGPYEDAPIRLSPAC